MSSYSTCDKCGKLTEGSGDPAKFCKGHRKKLSPEAQHVFDKIQELSTIDKNWVLQKLLGNG